MAISTTAIYEKGVLKPAHALPLRERQVVQILVVTEVESISDEARIAWMQREVERWLAQQPTNAIREPLPLSLEGKKELDAEFDQLLAEIRQGAEGHSEEEVMADVKEALGAIREANG